MSFTLKWTGQRGADSLTIATAEEALNEYDRRNGRVARLTIEDDSGHKLTEDDLFRIINPDG